MYKNFFCFLFAFVCMHSQSQAALSAIEQLTNEAKQQQMQHDTDMARMQDESERIRIQIQLMRQQIVERAAEGVEKSQKKTIFEMMGDYQEQKQAAETAAREKSLLREEAARSSARSANTVYLCLAIAFPLALGLLVARKAKTGQENMKYEEKFGILLMIAALLLGLLAFSISDNWASNLDAMQNLMLTLKIRIFPENESPDSDAIIDVYTKHVLLLLATIGAYGFTTYLGITPALNKSKAL